MDKEKIVKMLTEQYAKKPREAIRAVASDLFYAGDDSILAESELVDRLFEKWEQKKKEDEVQAATRLVDDANTCPICKTSLSAVKLSEGRSAKYCSKHFVVMPTKDK